MKKRKKYRFYIWDYIWWLGDKHQEKNPGSKLDGPWMFFLYGLVILVMIKVLLWKINSPFLKVAEWIYWLYLPLFFLWDFRLHKIIYNKERREAVMKHYASRNHSSTKAFVVMVLPVILLFIYFLTDMTNNNRNRSAPQITPEEEIENINRLQKFIKPDSLFIRQPIRFRPNGEQ